jgi:hypothetical protein
MRIFSWTLPLNADLSWNFLAVDSFFLRFLEKSVDFLNNLASNSTDCTSRFTSLETVFQQETNCPFISWKQHVFPFCRWCSTHLSDNNCHPRRINLLTSRIFQHFSGTAQTSRGFLSLFSDKLTNLIWCSTTWYEFKFRIFCRIISTRTRKSKSKKDREIFSKNLLRCRVTYLH